MAQADRLDRSEPLVLAGAMVDLRRRELHRDVDGQRVTVGLTTRETELLAYLAARPSAVVGWDELHREIWGHHEAVVSRAAYFTWRRLLHKVEPEPDRPVHLLKHHGDGVIFVPGPPLSVPDTVRSAPRPRTNLGRPGEPSFGRASSRQQLAAAWQAGVRWVSVVGPAGVGKSRLARDAAEELLDAGEVWWCGLSCCEGPEDLATSLVRLLGVRRIDDAPRALDARRAVLVLDDADAVLGAVASLCEDWLRQTRHLRILVTSRTRAQRVTEAVVELGPLEVEAGVALYVDRARRAWPECDPEAWRDDIAALVRRLDGLPLAIELAAARAAVLSPRAVALRDDPFRVLRRRGDAGRHGSLWAALNASWERLDLLQKRAFARLAVFHGGFTLPAAEAVLVELCTEPCDAVDLLDGLCAASLVRTEPVGGVLRFGLYQTLRAFADAQLAPEDRRRAERRHADWFGARAREWLSATSGHGPARADAELAPDVDNLRVVWERLPTSEPAAACVGALSWLGRKRLPQPWIVAALKQASEQTAGELSACLGVHRAVVAMQARDLAEAWSLALVARDQGRGGPWETRAEIVVAQVAQHRGEPKRMLESLAQLGDGLPPRLALKAGEMRMLALLGLGRLSAARQVGLSCLAALAADPGADPFVHAVISQTLASVELALGRASAAVELLGQARDHLRSEPPPSSAYATTCTLLGIARIEADAADAAVATLEEAIAVFERCGDRDGVARATHNLGLAHCALGRTDEARRHLLQVVELRQAAGRDPVALLGLTLVALTEGDLPTAEALLAEVGLPTHRSSSARVRFLRVITHARAGRRDAAEHELRRLSEEELEGEAAALLRTGRSLLAGEVPRDAQTRADDRYYAVRWARALPWPAHGESSTG